MMEDFMMVVPDDRTGAEESLSPSDVTAMQRITPTFV